MTAKSQEPEPASVSAAWASLVARSVPGAGVLFGQPWTAWLAVLGLAVAVCSVLLGCGMQDEAVVAMREDSMVSHRFHDNLRHCK
jgi:hypothetical protein